MARRRTKRSRKPCLSKPLPSNTGRQRTAHYAREIGAFVKVGSSWIAVPI